VLLVGIHDVHEEIVRSEIFLPYRVVFDDFLCFLLVDFLIYFTHNGAKGVLDGGGNVYCAWGGVNVDEVF
jgi:hypothetical protein